MDCFVNGKKNQNVFYLNTFQILYFLTFSWVKFFLFLFAPLLFRPLPQSQPFSALQESLSLSNTQYINERLAHRPPKPSRACECASKEPILQLCFRGGSVEVDPTALAADWGQQHLVHYRHSSGVSRPSRLYSPLKAAWRDRPIHLHHVPRRKWGSPPFNISVTIAAICHGSGAGVAHVAVSLSNKAASRRGQSLGGESRAPEDRIGVIEGAALSRDRNARWVLFVLRNLRRCSG